MNCRNIVFLGPTLPVEEARRILPDAVYLPPVEYGNLTSAAERYHPEAIGIVDGVFFQTPSVWHKEILHALHQGIRVYGASSMGALRAAETAAFGTIGVGEIFRMYVEGELEDDDEVVLAHGMASHGFRPLSAPMVNVRKTFEYAREEGIIGAELCGQLIDLGKGIYFPLRTFPTILRQAADDRIVTPALLDVLVRFCQEHYVDLKRLDAIAMLEAMRDGVTGPPVPEFDFACTHNFAVSYHCERKVQQDHIQLPLSAVAAEAALHGHEFDRLSRQASYRQLVLVLADLQGIEASDDQIVEASTGLRERLGLHQDETLAAWLSDNDMSAAAFQVLATEEARCHILERWLLSRTRLRQKMLLDELRLDGTYPAWKAVAADKAHLLDEQFAPNELLVREQQSLRRQVGDHIERTGCTALLGGEDWLLEAGFPDECYLRQQLWQSRLAYVARGAMARKVLDGSKPDKR